MSALPRPPRPPDPRAPTDLLRWQRELSDYLARTFVPTEDAIANPTGGATVDTEARAALVAILEVMRARGEIET